jgi:CrcB protein
MGSSLLLVAIGAVPGAWLRFRLVNHFEPQIPAKHWGTLMVNVSASFALGLITAINKSCDSNSLILLVATGFLGSLSTFSTLMIELFILLHRRANGEALILTMASLICGLLAVETGLWIGAMP